MRIEERFPLMVNPKPILFLSIKIFIQSRTFFLFFLSNRTQISRWTIEKARDRRGRICMDKFRREESARDVFELEIDGH